MVEQHRFHIVLPEELYLASMKQAVRKHRTLKQHIVELLRESLEREDARA